MPRNAIIRPLGGYPRCCFRCLSLLAQFQCLLFIFFLFYFFLSLFFFAEKHKKKKTFLNTKTETKTGVHKLGIAYETGTPCQNCSSDRDTCVSNLCSGCPHPYYYHCRVKQICIPNYDAIKDNCDDTFVSNLCPFICQCEGIDLSQVPSECSFAFFSLFFHFSLLLSR